MVSEHPASYPRYNRWIISGVPTARPTTLLLPKLKHSQKIWGETNCFNWCQNTAQWPKRVKTEKKLTGSKIGAIFCKITSRITTQNLKIGPWGLFEKFAFLFFPIIKSVPRKGQNTPKSDFRGPKIPPEVRVGHETCSTICGTPVQAILDQKKIDRVGRGGKKKSKNGSEWASFLYIFGLGAF